MNCIHRSRTVEFAVLLLGISWSALIGQTVTKAADPAPPEAPHTLLPSWLQLGAELRGRWETPSGIGYADSSSSYYLSRLRGNLTIRPVPWLRFFAQVQDSRVGGYPVSPAPSTIYNPADLRQGYVEIGSEGVRSMKARVGRQEMLFGSGRLIGGSDWGNCSRSLDAARLTYAQRGIKADLFEASPVQIDSSRFDRHKPGDHLWGSYFVFDRLISKSSVESYYLLRRQKQIAGEHGEIGNATLSTIGIRSSGRLPLHMDYAAEWARQFGIYARDRVSAMAGTYMLGWTVNDSEAKPRFSAEYNHASGDGANKDGRRQTFDQLFASSHSVYGLADQVGWRNMRDVRSGFGFLVTRKIKFQTDWNDFHLATVQDGLYNSAGVRTVLNRRATSTHVGMEADVQGVYQFSSSTSFGAGLARLFPGAYLKESTAGKAYTYPYLFWTKRL